MRERVGRRERGRERERETEKERERENKIKAKEATIKEKHLEYLYRLIKVIIIWGQKHKNIHNCLQPKRI